MKIFSRHAVIVLLLFLSLMLTAMLHAATQGNEEPVNPLQLAANAGINLPDNYTWKVQKPFVFFFRKDAAGRAGDIMEMAHAAHQRIIAHVGINPPGWIQVYLTSSSEEYRRLQPKGNKAPEWAVGLAYGDLGVIYLRQAGRSGQAVNVEETFVHELSHIIVRRATKENEVPRWFSEGMAMYHARQFSLELIKTIGYAILTRSIIPLRGLENRFPGVSTDIELAYAESFEFVNFLVNEFGERKFHKFVRRLASGGEFYTSLEESFGLDVEKLEEKWLSDLKLNYAWLPAITSGGTLWGLASLFLVIGYLRKRRERKKKMLKWEEQENNRSWAYKQNPVSGREERRPIILQNGPLDQNGTPDSEDDESPEDDSESNDPTKYIH